MPIGTAKIPTVDQLLAYARLVEGDPLTTLHLGRHFTVAAIAGRLEIVPASGKRRSTDRAHIGEVLSRLDKTASLQPRDYKDLTHNASYVLALVKKWQAA